MKINQRVENIFAHAVALQQSGRLRSTVYCIEDRVYVLNQDLTVLLRFGLRKGERIFTEPVSFNANDYDSKHIEEKDGRICFVQEATGFVREKTCRTPGMSPEEVEELWASYAPKKKNRVDLHEDFLGLLDDSLSHVEFSADKSGLRIVQRNIYSGSILELRREEAGGFGIGAEKVKAFSPIGLRTPDLFALFSFVSSLTFYFGEKGAVYVVSGDKKMPMEGMVSKCVYDELGGVDDGREE